ncbi:hypothetical protein FSP39_012239 [Pinctada imbricata]|uniref:MULE transposase domain-containing protein n=1 Tax=Pinctada imbricata TaxID=66713 RepID=A0AA88YJM3_PINIB|nr:hypothetical protein FSP39_012239 [Pinctada imbricata]
MAYISSGERRGKILINDGYKYQKNRIRKDKIHWRCWREDCRAPLHTNIFDVSENNPSIRILFAAYHDHEVDEEKIEASRIRREMIAGVSADPSMSARQAYERVAQNVQQHQRDSIPPFSQVRSSLDQERRRHILAIPSTVNQVAINGRWRRTESRGRFLSKLDNGWGIAIFCTDEQLRCLGECEDIYLDATFKSVRRPYTQFFTLHGFYQDRVIPFAFALMANRQVGSYRQILRHLKTRYHRLINRHLQPSRIIADFETPMKTAAVTEFPQARWSGCFFHFCKSIWRRIVKDGLRRPYNRNREFRKCVRKLMALVYLPVALVRQNYLFLRQRATTRLMCIRYPRLLQLFLYFERNYLNGQFPPACWNVYNRDMDNRTNNHVESFNKRWNATVGRVHPNIWYFLRKLRTEEKRGSLDEVILHRLARENTEDCKRG